MTYHVLKFLAVPLHVAAFIIATIALVPLYAAEGIDRLAEKFRKTGR